jgi:uncharacterized membrane protein
MRRGSAFTLLRACFLALAVLPLLSTVAEKSPALGPLARPLEAWFAFQCERDPARTFEGFSVCARCYGVYLGLALGALVQRPRIRPFQERVWLAVAALVMGLDVASEVLGMRPAFAPLRLATGVLLGYPASLGFAMGL